MRNSIQWRDKDLSDGYYGTEAQVAREVSAWCHKYDSTNSVICKR